LLAALVGLAPKSLTTMSWVLGEPFSLVSVLPRDERASNLVSECCSEHQKTPNRHQQVRPQVAKRHHHQAARAPTTLPHL
jgi:hypothetical protein